MHKKKPPQPSPARCGGGLVWCGPPERTGSGAPPKNGLVPFTPRVDLHHVLDRLGDDRDDPEPKGDGLPGRRLGGAEVGLPDVRRGDDDGDQFARTIREAVTVEDLEVGRLHALHGNSRRRGLHRDQEHLRTTEPVQAHPPEHPEEFRSIVRVGTLGVHLNEGDEVLSHNAVGVEPDHDTPHYSDVICLSSIDGAVE